MKTLTSLFIFAAIVCFSHDCSVDLRLDIDPINAKNKSSLNIVPTHTIFSSNLDHAFLISPEISIYAKGSADFSLALAHRHLCGDCTMGHSILFSRYNFDTPSFTQIGMGVDFQAPSFDLRVNYYHPLVRGWKYSLQTCKWLDSEILFKAPHFNVGTGPLYNIDNNTWALHSRISVPVEAVTFSLGALCGIGEYMQPQAILSVSFGILNPRPFNPFELAPFRPRKLNIYYSTAP